MGVEPPGRGWCPYRGDTPPGNGKQAASRCPSPDALSWDVQPQTWETHVSVVFKSSPGRSRSRGCQEAVNMHEHTTEGSAGAAQPALHIRAAKGQYVRPAGAVAQGGVSPSLIFLPRRESSAALSSLAPATPDASDSTGCGPSSRGGSHKAGNTRGGGWACDPCLRTPYQRVRQARITG